MAILRTFSGQKLTRCNHKTEHLLVNRSLGTTLRASPASHSLTGLVQITFKLDWGSVKALNGGYRAIEAITRAGR